MKLNPDQYQSLMNDMNNIIKNVRRHSPSLANMLEDRTKSLHWHVQSLELEAMTHGKDTT